MNECRWCKWCHVIQTGREEVAASFLECHHPFLSPGPYMKVQPRWPYCTEYEGKRETYVPRVAEVEAARDGNTRIIHTRTKGPFTLEERTFQALFKAANET